MPGNVQAYQDVFLLVILVVDLNQCLRYDEIQKLKIESVTVMLETVFEGSINFTLSIAIKN